MTVSNQVQKNQFEFTGKAGELFGIVFVNGLLNMITLGVYSPWAKVRVMQYLYGNTSLANSEFHFTATPIRMLVSRLIALALFITFIFVENVNSKQAIAAYVFLIIAFLVLAPILTVFVMSFRLRHTRWRGINFKFQKDYKGAYRVYLAPIMLVTFAIGSLAIPNYSLEIEKAIGVDRHLEHINLNEFENTVNDQAYLETDSYTDEETDEVTDSYSNPYFYIPSTAFLLLFIVLIPYFDFINFLFLTRNVKFGTVNFTYQANIKEFYQAYGFVFLIATLVIGLFISAVMDIVNWSLFLFGLFLAWPFTLAILKSRRYNLLFGRISIDNNRFKIQADVPTLKMLYLMITNTICIVISFGLLKAWANIRTANLLLQHTHVETEHSFDTFVAEQNEKLSAIGEEIADVFDQDLAF